MASILPLPRVPITLFLLFLLSGVWSALTPKHIEVLKVLEMVDQGAIPERVDQYGASPWWWKKKGFYIKFKNNSEEYKLDFKPRPDGSEWMMMEIIRSGAAFRQHDGSLAL